MTTLAMSYKKELYHQAIDDMINRLREAGKLAVFMLNESLGKRSELDVLDVLDMADETLTVITREFITKIEKI